MYFWDKYNFEGVPNNSNPLLLTQDLSQTIYRQLSEPCKLTFHKQLKATELKVTFFF